MQRLVIARLLQHATTEDGGLELYPNAGVANIGIMLFRAGAKPFAEVTPYHRCQQTHAFLESIRHVTMPLSLLFSLLTAITTATHLLLNLLAVSRVLTFVPDGSAETCTQIMSLRLTCDALPQPSLQPWLCCAHTSQCCSCQLAHAFHLKHVFLAANEVFFISRPVSDGDNKTLPKSCLHSSPVSTILSCDVTTTAIALQLTCVMRAANESVYERHAIC